MSGNGLLRRFLMPPNEPSTGDDMPRKRRPTGDEGETMSGTGLAPRMSIGESDECLRATAAGRTTVAPGGRSSGGDGNCQVEAALSSVAER